MTPTRVRFRDDTGFELFCFACHHWWPSDLDFWMPHQSMLRCKACVHEGRQTRPTRKRPLTPAERISHREYNREWMRRYRLERRRQQQKAAA